MNVVEAYDPNKDTWSSKAAMPIVNDSVLATVDNGIVYLVGGFQPGTGRIATVMSYNPTTNTWTTLAPLKIGKSQATLGVSALPSSPPEGLPVPG